MTQSYADPAFAGPSLTLDGLRAAVRKFDEQFAPPKRIIAAPADEPSIFGMKVLISDLVPAGKVLIVDERAMREAELKIRDRMLEGLLSAERHALITGSIGAVPFALPAPKPQPRQCSPRRAARRRHSRNLKRNRA